MKIKRILLHYLFILYIWVLLRITVFRSGFSFDSLFQNGKINLTFMQGYIPLILAGRWFRLVYLFIGNIVWFVPFGVYLLWANKMNKIWKTVIAGLLLSLIIECLQYVLGTGISELDDLFLNTLGTWVGACGYYIVRRILMVNRSVHAENISYQEQNEQ